MTAIYDEINFQKDRELMVEHQIKGRGVKDERVIQAISEIPRHWFVKPSLRMKSYDDCALPIDEGQTISQPYMVALMTEMLELTGVEKALELGSGSGYQTAILSKLVAKVFSIERIGALLQEASKKIASLNLTNVQFIHADGTMGYMKEAPFDVIIVTAASPSAPAPLLEQLRMGGRMVVPVGDRYSQMLYKIKKTPSGIVTSTSTPCMFVPLIGKYGWDVY